MVQQQLCRLLLHGRSVAQSTRWRSADPEPYAQASDLPPHEGYPMTRVRSRSGPTPKGGPTDPPTACRSPYPLRRTIAPCLPAAQRPPAESTREQACGTDRPVCKESALPEGGEGSSRRHPLPPHPLRAVVRAAADSLQPAPPLRPLGPLAPGC